MLKYINSFRHKMRTNKLYDNMGYLHKHSSGEEGSAYIVSLPYTQNRLSFGHSFIRRVRLNGCLHVCVWLWWLEILKDFFFKARMPFLLPNFFLFSISRRILNGFVCLLLLSASSVLLLLLLLWWWYVLIKKDMSFLFPPGHMSGFHEFGLLLAIKNQLICLRKYWKCP